MRQIIQFIKDYVVGQYKSYFVFVPNPFSHILLFSVRNLSFMETFWVESNALASVEWLVFSCLI